MKPLHLIIGLLLNVAAGIICYYIQPLLPASLKPHWITIAAFVLPTTFLIIQLIVLRRFRQTGLIDIAPSMTSGKGCTKSLLGQTRTSLDFMGIAAQKWIKTGSVLEAKLIDPFISVRFLLLDPDSRFAEIISLLNNKPKTEDAEKIRHSLKQFKQLRDRGCKVQVRLYSFLPLFRVAAIDQKVAFVGFYRSGTTGEDSPQLIFDSRVPVSFLHPFRAYFERVWQDANEPDWAKY